MPTDTSAEPETIFQRRESEARSYCRGFPVVFTKAEGSTMTDSDGREYIDFLAGCSSLNYGHNDPDMKSALVDHITRDGITHGLDLHTDEKAAFLEAFEKKILEPRGMDYKLMFMGPTGTNAVEAAMKLARKVTGRTNIVSFTNGFHGVTLGALAATGNGYHRGGAGTTLHDVTRMPFDGYMGESTDSADLLEAMLDDKSSGMEAPAAILLETVQGEGGLNAASGEWVKRVAELAKKHGALLIIDDIQAGCGRTGTFFSFEEMGVKPDIVTMAKSLSGFGLPFATMLIKPEHDVFGPAEHNGTFRGNTHAFVTAAAAVEHFWQNDAFANSVKAKGKRIADGMQRIIRRHGPDSLFLKGRGMMIGISCPDGEIAAAVCRHAFENGLVIETSGAHSEVVKCLCPLIISDEQIDKALSILDKAFAAVMSEQTENQAS